MIDRIPSLLLLLTCTDDRQDAPYLYKLFDTPVNVCIILEYAQPCQFLCEFVSRCQKCNIKFYSRPMTMATCY